MILLFAGAGASKAVDPQQYPTTVEFFARLPQHVTADDLFARAVEYLTLKDKTGPIDIEQVLWLIGDLREFIGKASDSSTIPGWFIEGNRLSSAVGSREDLGAILNVANIAKSKIQALASRINECVYDLYRDPPSEDQLKNNWIPLFDGLMVHKHPIEVVTTNYDIVIEEAIEYAKAPVLTGRTRGTQPILDKTLWEFKALSATTFMTQGRLTKLHGSVDWIRGGDRIYVGNPLFHGQHERHAIIYPGFKGQPTDDLFQVFHRYFQAKISEADIIIFIGYAFRDEYINRILSTEISKETKLVVINPEGHLPNIPFPPQSYSHLKSYFDMDTVHEVLSFLGPRLARPYGESS
ncbi:MAG TPA: SIR2 family protein [Pyrinomonadaceae bacterium]|nr:SIR2 family protein [Pyrinomonadaceae bacterium]